MSIRPGEPVNPISQAILVSCAHKRRSGSPVQGGFTIGIHPRYKSTDDILADLDMLTRYAEMAFREREGLHANCRVHVHVTGIVAKYT
ncbi:hypothetical protein [Microvirga sp. G4-2]|uniref:hypothetical protein n=1 Tax=Microvirga sp. G4-2 TaxID=3434467 RepID=UPI004043A85C